MELFRAALVFPTLNRTLCRRMRTGRERHTEITYYTLRSIQT